MNDEDIRKIVDDADSYDEAREDSLRVMMGEFYSRRMSAMTAMAWVNSLAALAVAAFCAIRFFGTDLVKDQIMYAVVFLTMVIWIAGVKTLAWLAIYRRSIARDIKRLELRLMAAGDAGRRQPGAGGRE